MKRLRFSASPHHRLGNVEFGQFVQSQVDRIRELSGTELTDEQIKAIIATLLGLQVSYDKVLALMRRSALTEEISTLDRNRNVSMRTIIRALKTQELSRDQAVVRAVAVVRAMVEPFGDVTKLKLEEETKAVNEIIMRLEEPAYAALVTLLGIQPYVDQLKEDNRILWDTYNARTTAYMEKNNAELRQLRNDISTHYSLLCQYVEAQVNITAKPEYTTVFTLIDVVRKHFMAQQGRGADRKPTNGLPK